MENQEIRNSIKESHVTFWRIADELGVSSDTFSRWMRHELTGEKKEMVVDAIKACKAKQEKEVSA